MQCCRQDVFADNEVDDNRRDDLVDTIRMALPGAKCKDADILGCSFTFNVEA